MTAISPRLEDHQRRLMRVEALAAENAARLVRIEELIAHRFDRR